MNCKHKWDIGWVVWVDDLPRIKAECLICKQEFTVDFGPNFLEDDGEDVHEIMRREKRNR